MIDHQKPIYKYLSTYQQPKYMCWVWWVIMALTIFNAVTAMMAGYWFYALTQLVIAAFIHRINTLERYLTECNKAHLMAHTTCETET